MDQGAMAATPEELFARLDALGIRHATHCHPPLRTVAESVALRGVLPGGHCKSLFLRDRQGGLWLVVVPETMRLDMGRLARRLGAPRLSFASAGLMLEVLGVVPGAVTPFAVVNETAAAVTVVLDAGMMRCDRLNYHPLVNTATTALAPADLLRFLAACGHRPRLVALEDCARAAPP
jgi:Ala-tRNA(Pro) deacylase